MSKNLLEKLAHELKESTSFGTLTESDKAKIQKDIDAKKREIESLDIRKKALREEVRELERTLSLGERERQANLKLLASLADRLGYKAEDVGIDISLPKKTPVNRGRKVSNMIYTLTTDTGVKEFTKLSEILPHHTAKCGGKGWNQTLTTSDVVDMVGGEEKFLAGGWTLDLPNGKSISAEMRDEEKE